MDSQLRKGILEICVLTALKREESYGYRIIKDVTPYITISESTLYPILKRLEAMDYVTVYSVEYNSRLRKYYKITPEGVERINEFLNDWQGIEKAYEFIKGGVSNES